MRGIWSHCRWNCGQWNHLRCCGHDRYWRLWAWGRISRQRWHVRPWGRIVVPRRGLNNPNGRLIVPERRVCGHLLGCMVVVHDRARLFIAITPKPRYGYSQIWSPVNVHAYLLSTLHRGRRACLVLNSSAFLVFREWDPVFNSTVVGMIHPVVRNTSGTMGTGVHKPEGQEDMGFARTGAGKTVVAGSRRVGLCAPGTGWDDSRRNCRGRVCAVSSSSTIR